MFIIILNCYFFVIDMKVGVSSWQCTQQISKACGAWGRLVVSPHFRWSCSCCWWLFPRLQSDHPDCSCQSLQTEQPIRDRNTNWKLATKQKKSNAYKYLWSTVAAVKTSIFSTSPIISRNLLPCHFIYLFFMRSHSGDGTPTQHIVMHLCTY